MGIPNIGAAVLALQLYLLITQMKKEGNKQTKKKNLTLYLYLVYVSLINRLYLTLEGNQYLL